MELREIQSCSNIQLSEIEKEEVFAEYLRRRQLWTQARHDTLKKVQDRIEESTQQEQNPSGRCWILLIILFTFCIPEQLKKHITQRVQVLLGLLLFCCLIIGYIVLYLYYGASEEQIFLTTTKPSDFIECNKTLLSNSGTYVLGKDLKWRGGEIDGSFLSQGAYKETESTLLQPWKVNFFKYRANEEKFVEDMSVFISNITRFVSTLDNPRQKYYKWGEEYNPTFDNLIRLLFYSQQINGSSGTAVIDFNFPIQTFETKHFKFHFNSVHGFTFNFSSIQNFQDNFNFFATHSCESNCVQEDKYMGNQNLTQQGRYILDTRTFEYFQLSSFSNQITNFLRTNVYLSMSEPQELVNLGSFVSFFNMSETQIQNITDKIIDNFKTSSLKIDFDFYELFIYHHCYQIGVKICLRSNQNLNKLEYIFLRDMIPENLLFLQQISLLDAGVFVMDNKWFAMYIDHIRQRVNINYLDMSYEYHIYGVPFIYWDTQKWWSWNVVLHLFTQNQQFIIEDDFILHSNYQINSNAYLGSILYEFNAISWENPLQQIVNNSLFVENSYNNTMPPPFDLTSGVYSCKVKNAPSMLERIANTHATGELISIALVILLIIIFILIVLPKLRTSERSTIVDQLKDAIVAFFEQVADA